MQNFIAFLFIYLNLPLDILPDSFILMFSLIYTIQINQIHSIVTSQSKNVLKLFMIKKQTILKLLNISGLLDINSIILVAI